MYSDSIESRIDLEGQEAINISGLTGEMPSSMKKNVIYIFQH